MGIKFLDWTAPTIINGAGCIKKLPTVIKENGLKNVLIVTDKGLMGLHLLDTLFEELKANDIKCSIYDSVQPNPTIENIEETRALYIKNACEGFIAFGGGSPMDCAAITPTASPM